MSREKSAFIWKVTLEKSRIEAEKLSKEISSLKQKQNQYSQNKNYSRYSEPVKWELSGYYFQPSFADEPIGYYGNDVAAATVKAACGGTFSYSLWPWFAVGAGYENVANTSRTHSGNGHYTYKGWMFRMKLTLNPSNTFRIYLPISVGRYKYKLQYDLL